MIIALFGATVGVRTGTGLDAACALSALPLRLSARPKRQPDRGRQQARRDLVVRVSRVSRGRGIDRYLLPLAVAQRLAVELAASPSRPRLVLLIRMNCQRRTADRLGAD